MILLIIRFGVLFLIFLGYALWFRQMNVRQEFAPVIICSSIGAAVFLAGILNVMPLAVVAIVLFGLFQLRYLRDIKELVNDTAFIVSAGVFLMIYLYFGWLSRGTILTHYDNFSHWALVARDIVEKNSLPNFQSELITFQAYPTGTACFMYFVCKILGDSEGCMVFGQTLILISSIFSLGAFLRKKNWYMFFLIIAGGCYFLISNIQVTELLVDTVLPLLGTASIAIIYYYRNELKKAIVLSSPVFTFLLCVKNSGIYFVIVGIIFIFYLSYRRHNLKRIWKKTTLFSILVPCTYLYLWERHVAYVFLQGSNSKHAMSVSNYENILQEKTWSDIINIAKSLVTRTVSFENEGMILFILLLVVLSIGFIFSEEKSVHESVEIKVAVFCGGIYMMYIISLLAMYIFSMPLDEAYGLDSFERYNKTIVSFLFGILLLYILVYFSAFHKRDMIKNVMGFITVILLCYPLLECRRYFPNLYRHENRIQPYSKELRCDVENLKLEYQLPIGKRYLIYISDLPFETDYGYFLGKYLMYSNDIRVCNVEEVDVISDLTDQYDYLMICKEDDKLEHILQKNGLSTVEQVIQLQ